MQERSTPEGTAALASGSIAGRARAPEAAVTLPGAGGVSMRAAVPRVRAATGPLAGRIALASLMLGAFMVVAFAAARPSSLVARSTVSFSHWESGPLHGLLPWPHGNTLAVGIGFSAVMLAMTAAYAVALASVRTLSMRMIVVCVLVLHAILLMSPPLALTDLFNYLGYARLGGLHHLNPYTHGIAQELHDPVYRLTTWHHLRSPYGPLFTAASYLLAHASLAVAYWTLKAVTVAASLGFIALVWQCARRLGRDPRFAVIFVAANPIYLIYAIGGFHNDFFMLVPSTAAIALLLARRDRSAGAVLMIAVAVKFTAVLVLPFLLVAVPSVRRRLNIVLGAVLGAVPLAALSVGVFGLAIPNLSDQSTLLTDFSIPNLVGLAIGIGGGTPGLLRVANVVLVLTVIYFLRRQRDWLSGAGWSTLALIASLAWLVPWYVIWLLPLAALGTSLRLRRAAVALTGFLVVAFVPVTGTILNAVGINPMGSSVGQASKTLQHKLEQ